MKAIPLMYVDIYEVETGGLTREARLIGIRRAVQISYHLLPSGNPDRLRQVVSSSSLPFDNLRIVWMARLW
jgi:hypothetical protein